MEGARGTKAYMKRIQAGKPNTGQLHRAVPDGPLNGPVGATNHTLRGGRASAQSPAPLSRLGSPERVTVGCEVTRLQTRWARGHRTAAPLGVRSLDCGLASTAHSVTSSLRYAACGSREEASCWGHDEREREREYDRVEREYRKTREIKKEKIEKKKK